MIIIMGLMEIIQKDRKGRQDWKRKGKKQKRRNKNNKSGRKYVIQAVCYV